MKITKKCHICCKTRFSNKIHFCYTVPAKAISPKVAVSKPFWLVHMFVYESFASSLSLRFHKCHYWIITFCLHLTLAESKGGEEGEPREVSVKGFPRVPLSLKWIL